ncbi:hypothetical protein LT85_4638 [Collimonas arenae]|uniref:Uncharacterized protein n=1 Tax=Collimonas arenae TaxID=279058 RepID=A0A0A1FGX5_9BURK|nr:hypothetical protein LT85_4638 [Collimonas arenae]
MDRSSVCTNATTQIGCSELDGIDIWTAIGVFRQGIVRCKSAIAKVPRELGSPWKISEWEKFCWASSARLRGYCLNPCRPRLIHRRGRSWRRIIGLYTSPSLIRRSITTATTTCRQDKDKKTNEKSVPNS